jgi:DNA-binding GntR family transcriptional regulator
MASVEEVEPGGRDVWRRGQTVAGVRERILSDIATGVLRLGTMVQLSVLAERYGVSRTPVREAMSLLERDGLVVSLPQKGFLLRGVEPGEVQDIHLVRRAVEGAAAGLAATRMGPRLVEQLAAVTTDPSARTDHCYPFHEAVVQMSGSTRLVQMFEDVYVDVRRLAYAGLPSCPEDLVRAEHRAVLGALVRGDAGPARAEMEAHLNAVRARLVRSWLDGAHS